MKRISAAIFLVLLAAAGCRKNTPPTETQTMTVEQKSESTAATGCLRTGMAENTFVLMTTGASGAGETATYQLAGHNVDLQPYVGQQVNVSGTVTAESEIASSSGVPIEEKPKGTGGTPTIQTSSEVTLKQLSVESVQPAGGRCDQ